MEDTGALIVQIKNFVTINVISVLVKVLLLMSMLNTGTPVTKQLPEKCLKVLTRISFSNAKHVLIFFQLRWIALVMEDTGALIVQIKNFVTINVISVLIKVLLLTNMRKNGIPVTKQHLVMYLKVLT
jgi:membrane protein DedA with SNARE-associated domain